LTTPRQKRGCRRDQESEPGACGFRELLDNDIDQFETIHRFEKFNVTSRFSAAASLGFRSKWMI